MYSPSAFARHMLRLMLLAVCVTPSAVWAETPQLVSVQKIWDQGRHNAFTDLIRFRDRWYCTFREADDHVGGDGAIRVLISSDGDRWESAALLTEKGIDLRDPKLSIAADGKLMLVMGGSVYEGTKVLKGRQSRTAFSADGTQWSAPRRVLSEGDWLWRVTWHQGKAYGVSYTSVKTPAAGKPAEEVGTIQLVSSSDGNNFEIVTPLNVPDRPNETTLRFLPGGEMMALVRRETGSRNGYIGTSLPPYREWIWTETSMRLGGPNFIQLPNGALWAGTRDYVNVLKPAGGKGGACTVLAEMTKEDLKPVLLLPSGGDNSYPGFVWHNDLLWMSYYSSHEGKASIYLAKIRLKE